MKKKKKYTLSDYLLLGVFIVLLIIVLILVIKLVALKSTNKDTDFNIPIVEKKLDTSLSIDLKKLKDEKKDYILTIDSYYNKNKVKENLEYTLQFNNNSEANVKVYKNDSTKNLATNNKEFTIKDTFKANEKRIDTYKIQVSGNIKEGDALDIRVSSK